MSFKTVEVTTLHGYSIEDLIKLKDRLDDSYGINILFSVIMKIKGFKTTEITEIVGKSRPTVVKYIKAWNKLGTKALKDNRGGSETTFTPEMVDDLLTTARFRNPTDYGFISSTWTTNTLSEYIYQKYGLKYSDEWIRVILQKNNFSYKRGQYKPTHGDELKKLAFKKNAKSSSYCRKFF